MTHRELPREEWGRLAGTDLADVSHPAMVPTRVLVVEDADGRIVAHWSIMHVWHAEGLRIIQDHAASASVGRHLLTGLRDLLATEGATVVYTAAALGASGDAVREMLSRAGARPLPSQPFFWPVRERPRVE